MLRVQTSSISETQNEALKGSIIHWLDTFSFDPKSEYVPAWIIDSLQCIEELKKQKITQFNKAIEQCNQEYMIFINGTITKFQYEASNGILGENADKEVRAMLEGGFEIRACFIPKIDAVLDRIRSSVPGSFMKKIYKKLHDLDNVTASINLNDEPVTAEEQPQIAKILEKWKKEEAALNG